MTHQPLTKAEREELRRLLNLSEPSDWHPTFDADLQFTAKARLAVPRLLADLDAAEAERDELRAALIASGNAVGAALTDRCSSQFLCNVPAEVTLVYKRIAAQRDRAEAERDDYRERLADARQKLIAMEEQAMVDEDGMSMRPFDERLRKVEAERDALKAKLSTVSEIVVDLQGKWETYKAGSLEIEAQRDRAEAERDALKAKLAAAESAHSELFLSGQVAELRAKLAALLQAATDLREVAFDGPSEPKGAGCVGGKEGVFDWKQRIDRESAAAIAAARGGAS